MENSSAFSDPLEVALSTIRHQLGNLVNAMQLNLDVLQENFERYDDPRKLTLLERIRSAVWQQRSLVDALKSYAAFSAFDPKTLAFQPLWESMCEIAKQQAAQRDITLKIQEFTSDLDVTGDKTAIKKVFLSVLGNAFEALQEARHPEVTLRVNEGAETLVIHVQDNGPPVRDADVSRWFAPLYSTKPDRMGMGLTIAQKLLKQMGGSIDVDVTADQGVTASFALRHASFDNINGNQGANHKP